MEEKVKKLDIEDLGYSLELDVPNLKELLIKGYTVVLSDFKSLLSAHIDIKCHCTCNTANIQEFKTLGHVNEEGWVILACLLYNAPELEKLTFEQGFYKYEGGYVLFESSVARRPPLNVIKS